MRLWRILIAVVACLGPVLQYGLMVYDETLVSAAVKSVEFFSYFTILSNMLAAAALTAPLVAPLVAPTSRFATWAEQSGPRASIATYLAITGVVYHTMLASQWNPQGLRLVADTILHTITPIAYLVDLALRGGHGEARWIAAAKAMAFPALFGVWTLVHGALSGFYPYPFMNVAKRGYPPVVLTMVEMSLAFAAVALIFVFLLRVRTRVVARAPAPISA
ncbi:Pr6Pr family membrane protein [Caulobacter sp.]|uniref:Pr6Pr family membrane protein n=1 Tax=Caulobacter sp. TaxID=78 RepID=UPI001B1DFF78|nr:Pr6Pr family membrane protein [Caulobacter sp.]MBO9546647.1 Pr6Pr family membrane protein [Caulobacter sp.]